MNLLPVFSAILLCSIRPVSIWEDCAVDRALAIEAGDYVVVAMIPSDALSHDARDRALREAAEAVSLRTGKEVVLTDDFLAYLSLKRMSLRGVSEYERKALVSRLSRRKDGLYSVASTDKIP